eukprot:TRINITY_DN11672_c0_g1::TRINITY_DN11672_c0_g1_i1::g.17499::m.17499 TRINITY_DN11672_c0_g1::TRINITY_DN11672_c0_g1_i1::g.17499  ORF type:complete len:345 (-),score=71.48,sp/Q9SMQ4/SRK2F_ARATH/43.28/3e-61,Pkinase/PF00069.20/3.5e-66,Pkinase_Tyr/PF07714.12/2.4e-31,Kinase-like/PF14531.1/2.8e-06,Kdo/PF06293.9/0.0093,Kdo/PF06293.9/7.5e+02,RIO1/PF01163.17/4.1,RIO1/PF01163.17/0.32,APH/PF01636.18/5.5e+02,APH/PF01636.18/0.16 TRINITY_DN11672_c0_g1_i1:208-1242(-)
MESELDKPVCMIGVYKVCGIINKGGTAVVRKGINTESGEVVAMKFMSRSHLEASKMVSYVKREIDYGLKLQHNNVVQLKDKMLTKEHVILVFEYVKGSDLLDIVLQKGRLSEDVARTYFVQLLDGVEYVHTQGMCHRDLKPDNLLIALPSGALKIADFGFTKHLHSVNRSKVGTIEYMAPEVTKQQKYEGTSVDIWSIGCVLYVMLVGKFPFQDPKNPRGSITLQNTINCFLPQGYPTYLSKEVIDLLSRIFILEPSKRITLAQIKQHPWVCHVPVARPQISPEPPKPEGAPPAAKLAAKELETAYQQWQQPHQQKIDKHEEDDGELDMDDGNLDDDTDLADCS